MLYFGRGFRSKKGNITNIYILMYLCSLYVVLSVGCKKIRNKNKNVGVGKLKMAQKQQKGNLYFEIL